MFRKRGWIATAAVMLAMVAVLFWVSDRNAGITGDEQKKLLEDAVYRALVTCYAVEGRYPASIHYLEDNYGVTVDSDRFVIFYERFASNVLPSVRVAEKGEAIG